MLDGAPTVGLGDTNLGIDLSVGRRQYLGRCLSIGRGSTRCSTPWPTPPGGRSSNDWSPGRPPRRSWPSRSTWRCRRSPSTSRVLEAGRPGDLDEAGAGTDLPPRPGRPRAAPTAGWPSNDGSGSGDSTNWTPSSSTSRSSHDLHPVPHRPEARPRAGARGRRPARAGVEGVDHARAAEAVVRPQALRDARSARSTCAPAAPSAPSCGRPRARSSTTSAATSRSSRTRSSSWTSALAPGLPPDHRRSGRGADDRGDRAGAQRQRRHPLPRRRHPPGRGRRASATRRWASRRAGAPRSTSWSRWPRPFDHLRVAPRSPAVLGTVRDRRRRELRRERRAAGHYPPVGYGSHPSTTPRTRPDDRRARGLRGVLRAGRLFVRRAVGGRRRRHHHRAAGAGPRRRADRRYERRGRRVEPAHQPVVGAGLPDGALRPRPAGGDGCRGSAGSRTSPSPSRRTTTSPSWTFELRPGIQFHNGEALDAAARRPSSKRR